MLIKEISALIESIAPLSLQEDYDNAGLIVGHPDTEVKGILLCLDVTEAVIDEALQAGCDLIISHHPIIFRGLKKLNGNNYVERTVLKAIRNNIALYAAHTNLDNVLQQGVNMKIAQKLELRDLRILRPMAGTLSKLVVYAPETYANTVRESLFANGAGHIGNYSECSFSTAGTGTFNPGAATRPYSGSQGLRSHDPETRIEVLVHNHRAAHILEAVRKIHPYEEMAYDMVPLSNMNQTLGAGVCGQLAEPMESADFLSYLKDKMELNTIRYTAFPGKIGSVAVCGGSGSFLIADAKSAGADAYVTADIKYHEFFDAEKRIMLCDIGHYESEIFTLEIFYDVIKEKYPTFAVIFGKENTNPIQYFK